MPSALAYRQDVLDSDPGPLVRFVIYYQSASQYMGQR